MIYCETCRQEVKLMNKNRGLAFGILAAWFVGSVILPPLVIALPVCWIVVIGLFVCGKKVCETCKSENYRKIKKDKPDSKVA